MTRNRVLIQACLVCAIVLVLWYTSSSSIRRSSLWKSFFITKRGDIPSDIPPLVAATDCSQDITLPKSPHYYSQSREDFALLERYYSKPLKCNGTYLEIGALNGVTYSNTLFFERYLGWSGVLIEAQPANAKALHKNRPKSRTFGMAVCEEHQKTLRFAGGGAVGAVSSEMTKKHFKDWIHANKTVEIPCKPLSWILKKANVKQIDFFSLDVEGSEYFVLKTMDWSIPVGTFVVEVHSGDPEGKKRDDLVKKLLVDHGYRKANWNIRSYCLPGHDCTDNVVYENPKFPTLPM